MAVMSFGRRISDLAQQAPERTALTCAGDSVTRADLDRWTSRLARDFCDRGVRVGDFVTIVLPNGIEWFVTAIAAWKVGAIPQPVSSRLPRSELAAIVELAQPKVIVGVDDSRFGPGGTLPTGYRPSSELDDGPLPDVVSPAWKAPTSGGSTGRPKLIVSGDPAQFDTEARPPLRLGVDGCLVMPGPLYHNGPAGWSLMGLLWGNHVAFLARFDAVATLQAIDHHKADMVYLVPTMMKRISRLPIEVRDQHDLSSLKTVWHLAEPCPPWLKQEWIDWLGPDRILELYAGTEGQAVTVITGREWLEHRGSVGRPVSGEIMIGDEDGRPVPPGTVGEVWLRSTGEHPTYKYVGAEPKTTEGGWESLGDMGSVDEDGYLYLADRLPDLIVSGGANIYPAEIEAALSEHRAVRSCVVIGLPDVDFGQRTHAIVEAAPDMVDETELVEFLAERLVSYKIPRSWEFVAESLRDDAGKVRRGELRNARLQDGDERVAGMTSDPEP